MIKYTYWELEGIMLLISLEKVDNLRSWAFKKYCCGSKCLLGNPASGGSSTDTGLADVWGKIRVATLSLKPPKP